MTRYHLLKSFDNSALEERTGVRLQHAWRAKAPRLVHRSREWPTHVLASYDFAIAVRIAPCAVVRTGIALVRYVPSAYEGGLVQPKVYGHLV